MKVKQLLFSSLFLSAGFVACTNEVETFEPQAAAPKGYEMKDLKIGVVNGGLKADAETRAQLSEEWSASWDANDRIGAAMYNMATMGLNSNNELVVNGALNMHSAAGNRYASNTWFELQEGTSNIFASTANCMAGAYVLYYPYDATKTYNFAEVEVKPLAYDAENNSYENQTFDCENITAQVNQNIFAANSVGFVPGGEEMTKFTVEQIPNLYALKFKINKEDLVDLTNNLTILSVLMEATNGSSSVLHVEGKVQPVNMSGTASFDVTTQMYNNEVVGNVKQKIDGVKFIGGKTTERIIVDASQATQANDAYQIRTLGDATEPYYFSTLPVGANVTDVKFSIIALVDDKVKVYSKTYSQSTYAQGWNDNNDTYGKGLKSRVTGQGMYIPLTVALDIEDNIDTKVYTNKQFEAAWAAAVESEVATEIEFARELDLSDFDLTGAAKKVTFKGKDIIVNNASGEFDFQNNVTIKGNLTTTGASTFANLTVEGDVTVSADTEINGEANIGDVTVAEGKTFTAENTKNNIASISVEGENAKAVVNGKVAGEVKVEAKAIVESATNVEVGTLTIVDGEVYANVIKAATIDVQLEGLFEAAGALDVTTKITVAGEATIAKAHSIEALEIASNGEVSVTGESYGSNPVKAATIKNVTVKAGTNKKGQLTAEDITLSTVTNNGIITATADVLVGNTVNNHQIKGTVTATGRFDQNVNVNNEYSITVAPGATYNANADVTVKFVNNGTVNVKKDVKLYAKYGTTNNGTINVDGKLIEDVENAITCNANSKVKVAKAAEFILDDNTDGTQFTDAIVELLDKELALISGGKAGALDKISVAYTWTGNNDVNAASNTPVNGAINTIYVKDLTANSNVIAKLATKNLIFVGGLTLKDNLTMGSGNTVIFETDVTIASDKTSGASKVKRTFTLDGDKNKLLAGKTLTLNHVILAGTGKIVNGAGSKYNATDASDVQITVTNK